MYLCLMNTCMALTFVYSQTENQNRNLYTRICSYYWDFVANKPLQMTKRIVDILHICDLSLIGGTPIGYKVQPRLASTKKLYHYS